MYECVRLDLSLAGRVQVSSECMVTNTVGFGRMEKVMLWIGVVVVVLHWSMPDAASGGSSAAGGTISIDEKLARLVHMRDAGDLTPEQFSAAKSQLLPSSSAADTPGSPDKLMHVSTIETSTNA